MQSEGMGIIQIRDVPDDVQAELVRRAKASQQSLQQYMRNLVIAQTRRPDISQIWARVEERVEREGTRYEQADAVDDVRQLRAEDRWA
jgi:plasmid stability protein